MLKVAITGNIASGKSQVEKILLSLGYKVADTDKINHYILASDMNVIKEIKNAFKEDDVLDEQGYISREKLGKIVFSQGLKRTILEGILHRKIYDKVEEFFKENEKEKAVFVSVPLLFETKQEDRFDKIIFVSADEDVRLKRLMERNNYTKTFAKSRIAAQDKEDDKIKKSDFIIYNNTNFISLRNQVNSILSQLFIDKND